MQDLYRHKGQRKKLIELLRQKGITNEKVLKVMEEIPRHFFIPDSALHNFAYSDKPFPIGSGQTISQPYTVAFQTDLLEIKKGDKVLEIGTGSGYQSVVLEKLGAKVYSIERQKALFEKTKILLKKMHSKVKTFYGDGYYGVPAFAPYDKAIITCAAPIIPDEILKQLKVGGILIIPHGEGDTQIMKKIIKKSDTAYETFEYGVFKFVPMLKNKGFD